VILACNAAGACVVVEILLVGDRCSGRRSVLISTSALKELAIAIPAATHNTI
jgi:hypothetical protein